MTGVAWGEYQDYLYGRFDGQNHVDNAQTDRNGKVIWRADERRCEKCNMAEWDGSAMPRFAPRGREVLDLAQADPSHLQMNRTLLHAQMTHRMQMLLL